MTESTPGDPSEEMTIEELARRADVATTTVRMYQTRGLLPGPRRVGRVSRYGPGHLARLHMIGQLQERGFSLAGIQQLVETWEAGRGLDDLLGLEGQLPGFEPAPETRRLTVEEVAAHFPEGALTAEAIERGRELDVVQVAEDGRLEVQPGFLEIGAALVEMGIPLADVFTEEEALDEAMNRIVRRFAELFERHILQDFIAVGMPAERLPALADTLQRLSELATEVVNRSLQKALREVTEQFVADQAKTVLE